MESADIKKLIEKAVTSGRSVWADFGSGDGAFTLRLRELGGPDIEIYSVDKDIFRLGSQEEAFKKEFPGSDANIHFMINDFTKPLKLLPPGLDGILMANSLHFIKTRDLLFESLHKYLKPGGKLVIAEYDIDLPNFFVPYPLSFKTLSEEPLAENNGFSKPEFLASVPAKYQGAIYSSLLVAR